MAKTPKSLPLEQRLALTFFVNFFVSYPANMKKQAAIIDKNGLPVL